MSNIWGILAKKLTAGNDAVSFSSGYLNMEFDVITSEDHSWLSTVTSNPVENGQPVCDHIQRSPDKLDIKGIISNASMKRWRGSLIEKVAGMLAPESEIQQAFDKLRKLMDDRLPVTVYTRYRTYPNMVLTELSIPRQPSDGDSIEFNAKFTHIRMVSTLIINSADAGIHPKQTQKKNGGNTKTPHTEAEIKDALDAYWEKLFPKENNKEVNNTIDPTEPRDDEGNIIELL